MHAGTSLARTMVSIHLRRKLYQLQNRDEEALRLEVLQPSPPLFVLLPSFFHPRQLRRDSGRLQRDVPETRLSLSSTKFLFFPDFLC